jgi:hypothetical protein
MLIRSIKWLDPSSFACLHRVHGADADATRAGSRGRVVGREFLIVRENGTSERIQFT